MLKCSNKNLSCNFPLPLCWISLKALWTPYFSAQWDMAIGPGLEALSDPGITHWVLGQPGEERPQEGKQLW